MNCVHLGSQTAIILWDQIRNNGACFIGLMGNQKWHRSDVPDFSESRMGNGIGQMYMIF